MWRDDTFSQRNKATKRAGNKATKNSGRGVSHNLKKNVSDIWAFSQNR